MVRILPFVAAIAILLTVRVVDASSDSPTSQRATDADSPLVRAQQTFQASRLAIERLTGADVARDLFLRLADDIANRSMPLPDGYSAADWSDMLDATERLDLEATDELASGKPRTMSLQPGLHEVFVRSTVDGTMQPVAVYVPDRAVSSAPASYAIVLHGRDASETELLAQPDLRSLATASNTILIAPYGRGKYGFAEPGESDVRDAIDTALATLPIDANRAYLVGFSMGAFAVYSIGPHEPPHWKGVLAIAGSITTSDSPAVLAAWRRTPIYVVCGGNDRTVSPLYSERTAEYLATAGLPVSYYRVPDGRHSLRSLVPALRHAWPDMLGGTIRPLSVPTREDTLPVDLGLPRSTP